MLPLALDAVQELPNATIGPGAQQATVRGEAANVTCWPMSPARRQRQECWSLIELMTFAAVNG
jgi:hypothetical protein